MIAMTGDVAFLQVNLQQTKAASALVSKRFDEGKLDITLIQEPGGMVAKLKAQTTLLTARTEEQVKKWIVCSACFPREEREYAPLRLSDMVAYCAGEEICLIIICNANVCFPIWCEEAPTQTGGGDNIHILSGLRF